MASTDQTEQRKLELIVQLAEARSSVLGAKLLLDDQISEKKSAISDFLNFPKRVKRSFTEQPAMSFGVAIASGLGLSFILKRKPNKQPQQKAVKRSAISAVTFALARPILQKLAVQYSQQWLAQRAEKKLATAQRLNER
ncbi:MAG: hypothetical protein ABGY95_07775 [Rubritalea sp.]|uniref:hypothetical protein n=1 Tax=Rubritalea sp. TaxID=2109375 RepID=UPI003241F9D5